MPEINKEDPVYQAIRREVMLERLGPIIDTLRQKPKKMTEQRRPYRLKTAFFRQRMTVVCAGSCIATVLVSGLGWLRTGYSIGAVSAVAAVALAICLLREVLIGAGWDVEAEWSGPQGPFRTYQFAPSINVPFRLFATLALIVSGVLIGFAGIYFNGSRLSTAAFGKALDWISALYFSIVTFATIGYGDIAPQNGCEKLVVSAEILIAFFIIAVVLTTAISWTLNQQQQLSTTRAAESERRMQHTEEMMKKHGLGVYASTGDLDQKTLERLRAQTPVSSDTPTTPDEEQ